MPPRPTSFTLALPAWAAEIARNVTHLGPTPAERLRFAIDLARQNVERGTGGPFGAAVIERDTGLVLAIGVNQVVHSCLAIAHAEIVALALADDSLKCSDARATRAPLQLVSSVEPCMMCLGAVLWSGVASLAFGALGEDACAIGFDEGCKPTDWRRELEARGIEVIAGVERAAARDVLDLYERLGRPLYNRGRRRD